MILSLAFTAKLYPSTSRMWKAYAIAAAVAPLSLFVLRLISRYSIIVSLLNNLPALMQFWAKPLLTWIPASYVAGAIVAMPVAFILRRVGHLHGLSILAAALAGAIAFSIYIGFTTDSYLPGHGSPTFFAALLEVLIPFSLSALVFWTIAGYDDFVKMSK